MTTDVATSRSDMVGSGCFFPITLSVFLLLHGPEYTMVLVPPATVQFSV